MIRIFYGDEYNYKKHELTSDEMIFDKNDIDSEDLIAQIILAGSIIKDAKEYNTKFYIYTASIYFVSAILILNKDNIDIKYFYSNGKDIDEEITFDVINYFMNVTEITVHEIVKEIIDDYNF